MAKQQNIPHIKNVDLVPESTSHGGAPGFNSHFTFVVSLGLLLGILLFYLMLS
jgi:hypothetical protein